MSQPKQTLAFAVGGTRGHILLAKALYEELKAHYTILFLGVDLEQSVDLQEEEYTVFSIEGSNRNPLSICRGVCQSLKILRIHKVDYVVGFGSYHSLPPLLAAMVCRTPFSLYEPNTLLGRVNQILYPFAHQVGVCFPHRFRRKAKYVTPLSFKASQAHIQATVAKEAWGFHPEHPVILVVGGSQGARYINQMLFEASAFLTSELQILHIAGYPDDVERLQQQYREQGRTATVLTYTEELPQGYAAADMVISRAGAGALHSQMEYGHPAIYIPYPGGVRDHQVHNARYMAECVKGARVVLQDSLQPKQFANCIYDCLIDRHLYKQALIAHCKQMASMSMGQLIHNALQ